MGLRDWLLAGLGAICLLPGCFVVPDTLGNPCVVDEDCGGELVCAEEICVEPNGMDETGDSQADSADASTTAAMAQGSLRLVHASPDAGPVDVYLEGSAEALVTGLNYGAATSWFEFDDGSYAFELRAAGSDASTEALLVSPTVQLDEGAQLSAIAAGLAASEGDDALRILPVFEQWGADLAGRARVRIVHAGVDAPEVVIEGLEGPNFSLARYGDSPAAGLALSAGGGTRIEFLESDETLTAFTAPPLDEGDQVLLVATGLLGSLARQPDGFSLIAIGEAGLLSQIRQDPQVFTLHGARDAGNLENCTDGFEVAANFNYGEVQSAFLSPGEYDFEIFGYPSGCTGPALNPGGNSSGPLEAGERYLLLLTGEQTPDGGEPAIQVAPFRDRFALDDPTGSNIRFVHGASAEQIYVGNVTDGEVKAEDVYTTPIAWRSESQEVPLAEAFYLLGVADAVGKPSPPLSPLVTFDYTATPGARQWGIVSGDPSPEEGDGVIQLMLIDTATPAWDVELVDINL